MFLQCRRHANRALVGLFALLFLTACASHPVGLLHPNGVAVAPDGSLYVMDRGNYRIAHLSATGRLLESFGRLGDGPNDIYSGWNIALDPAGNIYICNLIANKDGAGTAHDGVKVFTHGGRFLREIGGQQYVYGDQSIPRNIPYGLDVDSQGRVYVADFGANTVRVFDAQGQPVAKFFGEQGSDDGQFNGPNDVAVDDRRGLMYVTDSSNSRVQQFNLTVTASGELTVTHRLSFGTYGREPGQLAYPQYMVVDGASGQVYVGDMGNRRVQVFDAEGQYVTEFAPPGVRVWQVMGLALGNDGLVYIADALNNVIWVFEPDGRLHGRIEVQP